METLKQPPPLSLNGDLSQNFKRWEQRFLLYFKASGAEDRLDKEAQKALLLHVIGDDALEVYNTLDIPEQSDFKVIGIPDVLYSDNGTNFSSHKFKDFAKEWEFEHKTSSPLHAQSNGLAERFIQTVKNIFRKADYERKDKDLALLELRNTPVLHDSELKTPSELLMGRQIRGLLPVKEKNQIKTNMENRLYQNANKQKYYYDKNTREMPQLLPGQNVIIKDNSSRKPNVFGKVLCRDERPNSYVVKTEKGNVINRNRRYLIHNKSDVKINSNNDYYSVSPDTGYTEITEPICTESISPKPNNSVNPTDNLLNESSSADVNLDTSANSSPRCNIDLPLSQNCESEVYRSRSGRNVQKPKYLSDYVTD